MCIHHNFGVAQRIVYSIMKSSGDQQTQWNIESMCEDRLLSSCVGVA